ncbi:XkdX family protein [Lactiplantibacillus plantarum]|uniref:XkdX family protein n=1 Tax=Lactiplantibacillus plantarum TaxID=1590 RepID=UPI001E4A60B8|nr:XkdX family protein [Lactiplantibacillus plantarum]MCC6120601.1 XkdX family protein [Lactiplantibacillus plantarum]MCW6137084.1 XkdX family protein [Lactiplantibacillus plantarum]
MMTVYEQCKIFKSWGQTDPNYYKVFVGVGLTADQYKEITGEDYVAPTTQTTTTSATN